MQGASGSLLWIAVMVAMMYFLILRPQKKQQKNREAMLDSLKKGDRVITTGGIHGIIRAIKDDRVTLEIASEIFVHFAKGAIASIVRSDSKAAKQEDPIVDDLSDNAEESEEFQGMDEVQDVDYVIEEDKPNE
jgi:preprotein translocase subunit YajC